MPLPPMRLLAAVLMGVLAALPAGAADSDARLTLYFNAPMTVEIAVQQDERAKGLSKRERVPHGTGMVFALPGLEARQDCFWMKDTWVPLDAAFIDADGVIIHIATMVPHSESIHCPPSPATWVLEAPGNWYQRQGYFKGMYVGDDNLAILRSIDTNEQP